jgi:hypothetical protein
LQKSKQSCAKGQGKGKREKGKTFILKPFPSFPVTTLFSNIIKFCQKKSNQKSRK